MPSNVTRLPPNITEQSRRANREARDYAIKLVSASRRTLTMVEKLGAMTGHYDARSSFQRAHAAAMTLEAELLDLVARLESVAVHYATRDEDGK